MSMVTIRVSGAKTGLLIVRCLVRFTGRIGFQLLL